MTKIRFADIDGVMTAGGSALKVSAPSGPRDRSIPAWAILVIAFAALLAGHLLLRAYMPNPAVGLVGFLLLIVILGYVLFVRNDVFAFVMVIYVCSHFSYADNQGGLWSLTAAVLIATKLALGLRTGKAQPSDPWIVGLLIVLVLWNVMGWFLRSRVPYIERIEGAVSFGGFLLVFYLICNVSITPARFRAFLVITAALFIYQVLVALNQRYAVINWNTPLLGAYGDTGGEITYRNTNAWGTIRHSELFGEYGALFWTFLIPILCCSAIQKVVRFGTSRIVLTMLLTLLVIAITSTRSAAVLACVAVATYFVILTAVSFRVVDRFGRQVQLAVVVALVLPLAGAFFGLDTLEQNFADLTGTKFTSASIVTGTAINRAPLFDFALRRLAEDSWFVGYGFGTLRANLWAWTGDDPLRVQTIADYHNLYLSLPVLYGWVGTVAFLWLILLTTWRAWRAALRNAQRSNFLVAASLGFTVLWLVFLADQFKISILRIPTYHMMFWIWLGLTTAVVRTLTATPHVRPRKALAANNELDAAS